MFFFGYLRHEGVNIEIAVQGILALLGVKDTPIFHRNKVSNMKEQTETVMLAADKLDEETLLKKLPFLTPDEVMEVMARKQAEMAATVDMMRQMEE